MTYLSHLLLLTALTLQAQDFTLGVGVYPGDPRENFAPVARIDSTTYRNLALHRPAYHSSSYDYNLTAQLITDGIKETALPRWISVSTSRQGVLKKNEREWILDGNWVTGRRSHRSRTLGANRNGRRRHSARNRPHRCRWRPSRRRPTNRKSGPAIVSGSDDGRSWSEIGRTRRHGAPIGRYPRRPSRSPPLAPPLLPHRLPRSPRALLARQRSLLVPQRQARPRSADRTTSPAPGRAPAPAKSGSTSISAPHASSTACALLDPPRHRRLAPGVRRCRQLEDRRRPARRAVPTTT